MLTIPHTLGSNSSQSFLSSHGWDGVGESSNHLLNLAFYSRAEPVGKIPSSKTLDSLVNNKIGFNCSKIHHIENETVMQFILFLN